MKKLAVLLNVVVFFGILAHVSAQEKKCDPANGDWSCMKGFYEGTLSTNYNPHGMAGELRVEMTINNEAMPFEGRVTIFSLHNRGDDKSDFNDGNIKDGRLRFASHIGPRRYDFKLKISGIDSHQIVLDGSCDLGTVKLRKK